MQKVAESIVVALAELRVVSCRPSGDGLDALAFPFTQEPERIQGERSLPFGILQNGSEILEVSFQFRNVSTVLRQRARAIYEGKGLAAAGTREGGRSRATGARGALSPIDASTTGGTAS